MVITNAQTASFFQDNDQMAIPNATVVQLATEGIALIDDLSDFTDDEFTQLASNLRNPPGIPNPNLAAGGPAIVPVPAFVLGAKSLKRLKIAARAVRYYEAISRPLSAGNMHYNNVLKTFELQWKALETRKEEDEPDVPKITKNLRVTRWSEAFSDFLRRIIGVRNAPLVYVIRENDAVGAAPPLANNLPYSTEHGSVEGELIARLSLTHPVYKDDNAKVYHYLEEATRGTVYATTLKKYQRGQNGRGAYKALISQHAGVDKWEKELRSAETFMKNRVWKGNNNFSLEKFLDQHRTAFVTMQQCSEHVAYQLPNERTRVGYVLDNIQTSDAELQAVLAQVKHDATPGGMREDFEKAATALLPADPVARKRKSASEKRSYAEISATDGGETNIKPGIGETGVEFRYHSEKEYPKLSNEQKKELRAWRRKRDAEAEEGQKKKKKKKGGEVSDMTEKKLRGVIASVIKEETEKAAKATENNEEEISELSEFLVSFLDSAKSAKGNSAATADSSTMRGNAVKLQGILKRGKKSA